MQRGIVLGFVGAAVITAMAYAQAPDEMEMEMEATSPPARADKPVRPEEVLRRADVNKDGKISFEEMKAARPELTQERFNAMDTNKDGSLGPEDRPAGDRGRARGAREGEDESRRQFMQMLMSTDADQDGKASYAEVTAAKPGFAKSDFDRVDRNKDGFITAADAPKAPQATDRPKKPGAKSATGNRAARLTPEQREKMRERLIGADTNADGYVSREEARTGLPNVTDERFKAMDRNGDGKLGPEDGPAGGAPRAN